MLAYYYIQVPPDHGGSGGVNRAGGAQVPVGRAIKNETSLSRLKPGGANRSSKQLAI